MQKWARHRTHGLSADDSIVMRRLGGLAGLTDDTLATPRNRTIYSSAAFPVEARRRITKLI
jgi:hypothetical protein